MSTLVIKNLPESLHQRLKTQAERNRRSVTQEAISLIESGITVPRLPPTLSSPVKIKGGPVTTDELEAWINEGRE
jgi:plasmid stability protein